MMISPINNYFLQQSEPNKTCLLFLRKFILEQNEFMTEKWNYGMPLYCFKGKRICYLWIDKKRNQPYVLFVDGNKMDHPDLIQDGRKRMKILYINPVENIKANVIKNILEIALRLNKG